MCSFMHIVAKIMYSKVVNQKNNYVDILLMEEPSHAVTRIIALLLGNIMTIRSRSSRFVS